MATQVIEDRLTHLSVLRENGFRPYALGRTTWQTREEPFVYEVDKVVDLVGRVYTIRKMGKMAFITLLLTAQDHTMQKMQIVFREGETFSNWKVFVNSLDTGDILTISGVCRDTMSGEPSVWVVSAEILSKALEPISFGTEKDGESFNVVQDAETLTRNRHVAFLVDSDLRGRLITRSRVVSSVRRYLDGEGYLEAQTPVLLSHAGGEARTFDTHYHAYGADVKLRMSLEISLKKLLCGGFDRVYEMGTVFRNEGADSRHNPEFTELEYYTAYEGWYEGVNRFKSLIRSVMSNVVGKGCDIIWEQMTYRDAILSVTGEDIDLLDFSAPDFEEHFDSLVGRVEDAMTGCVILTHYPAVLSPLAFSEDGRYALRFEAYVGGVELANGFCEQNDPILQRKILENQAARLGGVVDESFIQALSCGMPSAFGVGIGIERLVMLVTGCEHIRGVSWFPYVKPERVENGG